MDLKTIISHVISVLVVLIGVDMFATEIFTGFDIETRRDTTFEVSLRNT